jgi:hypothetical protein
VENWLSAAAVARAWSGNVDALAGGAIKVRGRSVRRRVPARAVW